MTFSVSGCETMCRQGGCFQTGPMSVCIQHLVKLRAHLRRDHQITFVLAVLVIHEERRITSSPHEHLPHTTSPNCQAAYGTIDIICHE